MKEEGIVVAAGLKDEVVMARLKGNSVHGEESTPGEPES